MNWEAIGAIGEVVGAGSVVVTLVYLAIQVRQNTKAERIGTAQQILSTGALINAESANNPELFDVMLKLGNGEELSPRERTAFSMFLASIFAQFWQVHFQYTQGSLDSEIFLAYERRTATMLTR